MTETVTYVGKDLEAMSFAENYHRWILDTFAPHLGRRIVEVGAGTGAMSELLLERALESLVLVEPSRDMFHLLCKRLERLDTAAKLITHNDFFINVANRISEESFPDSIIYVNVLEHVEDDSAELETISRVLAPRGRLFIFVPALAWLYSSFDEQIGHFRRYTRSELEGKCRRTGLRIVKSGYFDVAGMLPWWIKYRVLKSKKMEGAAVRIYDRAVVPIMKLFESAVPPPIGKNLFLIAEKSA